MEKCEVVYHVTYLHALDSIAEQGLDPSAVGVWEGTGYGSHSQRGLFLTEPEGVYFWYNRLQAMAEHNHEPEDLYDWTPVVVRVGCAVFDDRVVIDELGTRDAGATSYITTQVMFPDELQMWNGSAWVDLEAFDVQAAGGIEETEEDGERWWTFPVYNNPLVPPELSP